MSALLLLLAQAAAPAWLDADWLREHYAKSEHAIEMRDGARLYTALFAPRDAAQRDAPLPIVLVRTNFGCAPYGPDGYPGWIDPGIEVLERGVIVALQDVRGTHLSEGQFTHLTPHRPGKTAGEVDESSDGYDTIDWLVDEVPHNNGRVALMGGSYNGFFALASMIDAHPALVCAVPQAPSADPWHDDVFHNGALWLTHLFEAAAEWDALRAEPSEEVPDGTYPIPWDDDFAGFLETIGPLSRATELLGGASPLWNGVVEHPARDEFWRSRNILQHLDHVPPAVLVVGGWYDAEDLYGALGAYRALEPGATAVSLVMGPWQHGEWQDAAGDRFGPWSFGSNTAATYRREVLAPFLDRHLFEEDVPAPPGATVFDTGSNIWRRFAAWPPPTRSRALYPGAGGGLSRRPPVEERGEDVFESDPHDPVPYVDHATRGLEAEFMVADQRFVGRRPDVLTWSTAPLEAALTLAGPLEADLWVSTDRGDADWIVKWIDEAPGDADEDGGPGVQRLIRAEVLRGRYREDPARPRPFEAHTPTRVRFTLPDILHTFQPGQRIVIQVQSSWFPLIDRNPQTWVDSIPHARAEDFAAATHRVLRNAAYPSRFVFGELD